MQSWVNRIKDNYCVYICRWVTMSCFFLSCSHFGGKCYLHSITSASYPGAIFALGYIIGIHEVLDRFRSRTRTSKTTWKWRVLPMYGYATAFWRHFHVVFDVRVLDLNLSIVTSKGTVGKSASHWGASMHHFTHYALPKPIIRAPLVQFFFNKTTLNNNIWHVQCHDACMGPIMYSVANYCKSVAYFSVWVYH
jgi:hypothetical protein